MQIFALAVIVMASCIKHEPHYTSEKYNAAEKRASINALNQNYMETRMNIINSMESFKLHINRITLHDSSKDTTYVIDESYVLGTNDSVTTEEAIKVIPHRLIQWHPPHLPDDRYESYLTLDAEIFYNPAGHPIKFYEGKIYIPSEKELGKDELYIIEMKHGCQWYHKEESIMKPLFEEILLNPNVDNWK